jgi:curved DNA-binding protein CbpA
MITSPEAEEMFKLINETYQVLSDPGKRAALIRDLVRTGGEVIPT